MNNKQDNRFLQVCLILPDGSQLLTAAYLNDNNEVLITQEIMKRYELESTKFTNEINRLEFDEILRINRNIINEELKHG